jgi:uncharacterized membrane protein YfhO
LTSQFAFVESINIADDQIGVNAFCGTISLILACLFLLDKKRSLRERISRILLVVLLYASFDVNVLNYIWHGFHVQNGLPNRFAFLYIAMLVAIGFDVIKDLPKLSWYRVAVAAVPPIGFAVYAAWTGFGERETYVYAATILLLAAYTILLLIYRGKKWMSEYTFRVIFISLATAEMIATSVVGVCMNGTVGRSTYVDEQKAYEAMSERLGDDTFYRSDIDSTRMRNEDMFMGANGVVLFSSTMPAATVDLCKSLGMEARTNKNGYLGLTKLVNDLFGVKYIVSRTDTDTMYQMEKVDYEEPLAMYQNSGALSLGYMVKESVQDWDIEEGTPMEVQNRFVELATGYHDIFYENQEIAMTDGETYTILLPAGKQVYLYLPEAVAKVELTTPNYTKSYETYTNHLYDLGCYEQENMATITVTMKENQTDAQAEVYICDDAEYEQVHEILAKEQMETTLVEDGKIRGTVTTEEGGTLMLSIPYDEGWTVKVDGEKVEPYRIGEALTGISLTSGTHEIAMDYTPNGLWIGTVLTVLCVALFVVTKMVANRRDEEAKQQTKKKKHSKNRSKK